MSLEITRVPGLVRRIVNVASSVADAALERHKALERSSVGILDESDFARKTFIARRILLKYFGVDVEFMMRSSYTSPGDLGDQTMIGKIKTR